MDGEHLLGVVTLLDEAIRHDLSALAKEMGGRATSLFIGLLTKLDTLRGEGRDARDADRGDVRGLDIRERRLCEFDDGIDGGVNAQGALHQQSHAGEAKEACRECHCVQE